MDIDSTMNTSSDSEVESLIESALQGHDTCAFMWVNEVNYGLAIIKVYGTIPKNLRELLEKEFGFSVQNWIGKGWSRYYRSDTDSYLTIKPGEKMERPQNHPDKERVWIMETLRMLHYVAQNAKRVHDSIKNNGALKLLPLDDFANVPEYLLLNAKLSCYVSVAKKRS